jgi:hypothetical protein
MESFYDNLSEVQLKRTCRSLGISTHRGCSKADMLQKIKELLHPLEIKTLNTDQIPQPHDLKRTISTIPFSSKCLRKRKRDYDKIVNAILKLQRWWRSYKKFTFSNDTDFATLEPIQGKPFCLIEETGHVYQFNPTNLASYFLKEGNFVNPYTRKPLNVVELRRLDRVIKTIDPDFVSLREEQTRITQERAQEREHIRVCTLLHQECAQFIAQAIVLIRRTRPNNSANIMFQIEHTILPHFFDTFRQLFVFDQSFSCESILNILKGMCELWGDTDEMNTREKSYILETLISTVYQFITTVIPIMPSVLPELEQLRPLRVR